MSAGVGDLRSESMPGRHGAQEVLLRPGVLNGQHVDQRNKLGYIFLILVVLTWVGQSEVAQAVEGASYNRPYFISFFNHSLCMALGPLQAVYLCLAGDKRAPCSKLLSSNKYACFHLIAITVVYQVADWVWYIGLGSTTVAEGTIIFNLVSVFAFVLEWLRGCRKMSCLKGFAIALSFLGVVIVEVKPVEHASTIVSGCFSRLGGNIMVLFAAFLYAVYQVLVDTLLPAQSGVMSNALVSLQGLLTFLLVWPGIMFFDCLPGCCYASTWKPPSGDAARGLILSACLAFVFNIFFCLATIYTSPLTTAVGCMLTVPVSIIADWSFHGDSIEMQTFGGSVFIIAGFLLITF